MGFVVIPMAANMGFVSHGGASKVGAIRIQYVLHYYYAIIMQSIVHVPLC